MSFDHVRHATEGTEWNEIIHEKRINTKELVRVGGSVMLFFYGEVSDPAQHPSPLSAVRDCLFHILAGMYQKLFMMLYLT
jgi:hypothetical protein